MNKLYPIFVKLEGRWCLVVGGGDVALRKAATLLESGAHVIAVSKAFSSDLLELSQNNKELTLNKKSFEEKDLKDIFLVIAATNDAEVNKKVYDMAVESNILVNVVDKPELCNFYVPSSVTRGDLKIAISTDGKSPAMAKKIRKELEASYDEGYADLIDCLGQIRNELFEKYSEDTEKRGKLLGKIVNSVLVENRDQYSKEEMLEEMRKWI
jgi:precorrin-2 dehydrogenase/sirohydrochlorin ferrochelatase